MAFKGLKITDQGKEALAKAQNGSKMEFLYVAIGDGNRPVVVDGLTNLLFRLPLVSLNIDKTTCVIEADLNNANLDKGYILREIGIFVKVDEQEILYVYDNAGESAEFIPSNGAQASIEKRFRFSLDVSEVKDIVIESSSLLYATQKNLEKHEDNNDIHATSLKQDYWNEKSRVLLGDASTQLNEYDTLFVIDSVGFTHAGITNLSFNQENPNESENLGSSNEVSFLEGKLTVSNSPKKETLFFANIK